ncbi:MAG: serine/threonine protein phosphatase [Sphingomonas sp.]|nr:serine/threonine protein phosphatase [Sphingomonas sp.]
MFGQLRKKLIQPRIKAAVPDGVRVYAIGDIHGRADLLNRLLDRMMEDDAGRAVADQHLIFLGDLIDRGPDSAAVIERAIAIREALPNSRFLMGNHEEVFLKALEGDEKAMRLFCRIGGRETILSYGMSEAEYACLDYAELIEWVIRTVPARHQRFLESFEDMVIVGDYAFVHAGIRPQVPLDQQQQSDLRWIRDLFLNFSGPHDRIIVHGHTISESVEERSNRIGIDTGAYMTGRLSAMGFEGATRWSIEAALAA